MFDQLKKEIDAKLEYRLDQVGWEDIGDVLLLIEQSFNIELKNYDFNTVKTFGDLCDVVHAQIELQHQEDCTSQQAFYKVRKALSAVFKIEEKKIIPEVLLADLIPRENRIEKIRLLEQALNMELNLTTPKFWIVLILIIMFLLSLLAFFVSWMVALAGIAVSITGFWISGKLGKEIELKTVGELAAKMKAEHYLKSRSNPNTVNRKEIDQVLKGLFMERLGLKLSDLERNARFGTV